MFLESAGNVLVQVMVEEASSVPLEKKKFNFGFFKVSFYTGCLLISLCVCVALAGIVFAVMRNNKKSGGEHTDSDSDETKASKKNIHAFYMN